MRGNKMIVIGVSGKVASGKTTFANKIKDIFKDGTIIPMDNYFKDYKELSLEERKKINYDEPFVYDNELLLNHITKLKQNEPINMPIYSFEKYERTDETKTVNPAEILVVEGFACLYFKEIVECLDCGVFIDIDEETQLNRLIERDVKERGRTLSEIKEHFKSHIQDSNKKYFDKQKEIANIVLNGKDLKI